MEGIVVYHQRNRKLNIPKCKEILYEDYSRKEIISIHTLILDHIVPFCMSEDSSIENLQLLHPRDNKIKNWKDRKIINEFKKLGWIEPQTQNIMVLIKPKKFLKKAYLRRFREVSKP